MWDLIVSVPDHCLSFYFAYTFILIKSSRKGCIIIIIMIIIMIIALFQEDNIFGTSAFLTYAPLLQLKNVSFVIFPLCKE